MRFPVVRATVAGLAIFAVTRLYPASAETSKQGFSVARSTGVSPISGSFRPTGDVSTGEFNRARMSVEVVLAPRNGSKLARLLVNLYDRSSQTYGRWLKKGQFNSLFAPDNAQIAAMSEYLRTRGLVVEHVSFPFIVRASGSSSAVSAAFRTSLRTYRNSRGVTYFANASRVQLPTSIAGNVLGVVGLSNTVRPHPEAKPALNRVSSIARSKAGCEAPYPTRAELFASYNFNKPIPFGYGGSPGCNGLTPSQINSLYGAPDVGPRGKGAGVNLAVFELSAYRRSDIATWAQTFYGAAYRPRLVDIIVDGGPLSPICPSEDRCPPSDNGYAADYSVDADIQMQLAISPNASHILVYNAPFDETGQTLLDEYAQIANDDLADVVSSSWGECENDAGAAYVQAENLIFEQMALQGQSVFKSSGDLGAFDCIVNTTGTQVADTIVNVDDPAGQPWVTSVGGTSFGSYNPGLNPNPRYPAGRETVYNIDSLCNASNDNEGGQSGTILSGFFWCSVFGQGASGGGNSQYWGRPFYQFGPGVTNSYTAYGNGTTHCSFVAVGTPCREVPDISADADDYTPYAHYCTGTSAEPYSTCATFSSSQTPPGWYSLGGTLSAAPLWSAIFADRDSYNGTRSGNANPLLYLLYNVDPHGYFNDITGIGQTPNNNGLFPTTPGYDLTTGIGTPKMSAIITGRPQH